MSDPEPSHDAMERMFRLHRSRRLMVTDEGQFGLAPIKARRGDIVCILVSCPVPMVLRRSVDGRHQAIGECYIHGFMEGSKTTMYSPQSIELY